MFLACQVDGKVRSDMFYPAGFMDVVSIAPWMPLSRCVTIVTVEELQVKMNWGCLKPIQDWFSQSFEMDWLMISSLQTHQNPSNVDDVNTSSTTKTWD